MTEHQIKGCQTLAEVEGVQWKKGTRVYLNKSGNLVTVDYLHNWNDLHRVYEIISAKIMKEYKAAPYNVMGLVISKLIFSDKEQTFNALVEAAEWIKQQDK